jgi:hypothetical protein
MSHLWSYLVGQTTESQPTRSHDRESGDADLSAADWEFVSETDVPQVDDEFVLVPTTELQSSQTQLIPSSTLVFEAQNLDTLEPQAVLATTFSAASSNATQTSTFTFSTHQPEDLQPPTPILAIEPFSFDKADAEGREAWLKRQDQTFAVPLQLGFQTLGVWGSVINTPSLTNTTLVIMRRKHSEPNIAAVKSVQIAFPGGSVVKAVHIGSQVITQVSNTINGASGQQTSVPSGKQLVFTLNPIVLADVNMGQSVKCSTGSQVAMAGGAQSSTKWGSQISSAKISTVIHGTKGSEVLGSSGIQITVGGGSSVKSAGGHQLLFG